MMYEIGEDSVMQKCRVCDWVGSIQGLKTRELMEGTGDEFNYFICPKCHCLQIETVPNDLGKYYSNNYLSFTTPDTACNLIEHKKEERILDVGCGTGAWLCALAKEGYVNLVGCDPYVKEDLQYDNGVKIYKRTIHEMEDEFDRIVLNDSFEHMTDPHEVMESIHRLLRPNGVVRIAVPIFPNIAYDAFGTNWFQLDAPRHIVLYSKQGIEMLARQHNFKIERVVYDSNNRSFISSFLYGKGIPFKKHTEETIRQYFTPEEVNQLAEYAAEVNRKGYGDHAIFFLIKRPLI